MKENWKPAPGYEDLYEVSDIGRVRRSKSKRNFDRTIRCQIVRRKYWQVKLFRNGKPKNQRVHLLVIKAFIGLKPGPEYQTNHKDGNKLNNHYTNLEWATPKENMEHASKNGLIKLGMDNKFCKVTDSQVMEIRSLKGLMDAHELAAKYGVHERTIRSYWNKSYRKILSCEMDNYKYRSA